MKCIAARASRKQRIGSGHSDVGSREGLISVAEGSVLAVRWRSGEPPRLVRQ